MKPDLSSRAARQCRQHGPHRHRGYRTYTVAGTGALLAGALGYIGLVDPHNTKSVYPQCPFKMLTGWNCPFCGGLRMTHDLLHGDLAASINDNVFLVRLLACIPVLVGLDPAAPPPWSVTAAGSGVGDDCGCIFRLDSAA